MTPDQAQHNGGSMGLLSAQTIAINPTPVCQHVQQQIPNQQPPRQHSHLKMHAHT
jgi:hypothetical protein